MSTTSVSPAPRASNIYYLAPATPVPARTPRLSWQLMLRLRVLTFYWRCRLTAAETWSVLRRFGRPDVPADADTTFLEQRAEMILAAPPRPLGPARVIDLDAARLRLRG
ncbi:MAG TPA: hypothetical protein VFW70_14125 [Methylomirabilota bacterium]|jgi:hypothetical protein|nr:hypothetical protein [Methylomirabilota bacterium]